MHIQKKTANILKKSVQRLPKKEAKSFWSTKIWPPQATTKYKNAKAKLTIEQKESVLAPRWIMQHQEPNLPSNKMPITQGVFKVWPILTKMAPRFSQEKTTFNPTQSIWAKWQKWPKLRIWRRIRNTCVWSGEVKWWRKKLVWLGTTNWTRQRENLTTKCLPCNRRCVWLLLRPRSDTLWWIWRKSQPFCVLPNVTSSLWCRCGELQVPSNLPCKLLTIQKQTWWCIWARHIKNRMKKIAKK